MLVYFGLNLSSFYTLLWFSVSVIRCCWLEGYNPNRPRICSPRQPVQINARPGKWGLGTVQKKPSRESWGDLSGHRYIICPKPPYPAEKILNRRQLFFLAVPPWPVIKRLCPSRTIFSAWRWSSESLSNINRARSVSYTHLTLPTNREV